MAPPFGIANVAFFFSNPKMDSRFFSKNTILKPHPFDKQEDAVKKYFYFRLGIPF
ncbi:hypothetical protein [Pedobacter borealis]|uniref:hypothetical protein n=1 Tax=Pedobacter borealis TaxID=475254 RepID=UPI000B00D752|nr:hypothetical protein [Pedobacter borealis]